MLHFYIRGFYSVLNVSIVFILYNIYTEIFKTLYFAKEVLMLADNIYIYIYL